MKNILFTLALLVSFGSFGQEDIINTSKSPMTLEKVKNEILEKLKKEDLKYCEIKEGIDLDGRLEGREIFEQAGSWRAVFEARGYIFPLNNQSIIEMIKLGFKEQILIAKIETSDCYFNTSTKELKRLEELDVSTNVLVAMIKKPVNQVDQEWVKYDPLSYVYLELADEDIVKLSDYRKKWEEVAMELMPEEFNCVYWEETELEFFYKELYLKNYMRPEYELFTVSKLMETWLRKMFYDYN